MTTSPLSMHDVSRLAPACLNVLERNAGKPEFASHARTMVPVANAVLVAIQDLGMLKHQQVKLLAASAEQTALLHGLMLRWFGPLAHDIEGFDTGAFAHQADLHFDVSHKGKLLMRCVEETGAGLPYQEALLAELSARIEGADEAAKSAQAARAVLQEKQREVRERSAAFYRQLVSLRRTVRGSLGSTHVDNQRLRARSGRAAAEPPSTEAEVTVESATGSEPPSSSS